MNLFDENDENENILLKSPFNYTGSKTNLIPQMKKYLPPSTKSYVLYDIFCGGGGFFINVMDKFSMVIANDIITPLIQFYQWLQTTELKEVLNTINKNNISKDNKEEYLKLRNRFNQYKNNIDFFILTCCCTNNMMRFNKKFEFNQTWGKRNYNQNTEERLILYHKKIYRNPDLIFANLSFDQIKIENQHNPFVYLDPPYLISEAGYNAYWSEQLEAKLYDYIDSLNNKNIKFMMSNVKSHKNKINPYYDRIKKYNIKELDFNYNHVSRNKNMSNTQEIIIMNY